MSEEFENDESKQAKLYDSEEDLPDAQTGSFISKERFMIDEGEKVLILGVGLNAFNKPMLSIKLSDGTVGNLNIGNNLYAEMKAVYGKKPKDWVRKEVTLKANHMEYDDRVTGEHREGLTLVALDLHA